MKKSIMYLSLHFRSSKDNNASSNSSSNSGDPKMKMVFGRPLEEVPKAGGGEQGNVGGGVKSWIFIFWKDKIYIEKIGKQEQ